MNNSLFLNKTYSRNEIKGLLESILFVKGKPVSYKEIIEVLEIDRVKINELVDEINKEYNENKHGFFILNVADGLQLVSNPNYKDELEEIFGKRNDFQIPKSALETLAIIAYKQPITKEEIDSIRGVSSTRSINHLLSLKLITISGTHKELNLPVYSTTDRFLEVFRLKDLSDLPSINTIDFNAFDYENEEKEEDEEKLEESENLNL